MNTTTRRWRRIVPGAAVLLVLAACGGQRRLDVPDAEVTAEVPELDAIHEVMYPMWHDAFPNKDYAAIRELTPRFEPLLAGLEAAELPGILRHKDEAWQQGLTGLRSRYDRLTAAASSGDEQGMLTQTEGFHAAYEGLVRLIRPLVPELEAFHQELYKVYHYYAPEGDLLRLRASVRLLSERVQPLMTVALPSGLAERQEAFTSAAEALREAVSGLERALSGDDREAIGAAVERVHTAYGAAEAIFG